MTLATCAKDVKFYKWPSITLIGVYETPEDCVCVKSISWSNDGSHVVIVKSKGAPSLLVAPKKNDQLIEPLLTINKTSATVATFTNTRSKVTAFGAASGEITLFDVVKRRIVAEYQQLPKPVQNIEFSYDDKILAAGCTNGQIFLYNVDRKPYASFMVPSSYSLSVIAFNRANLLAAASKEGIACVWDACTADAKLIGREHTNIVTDIAFGDEMLSTVGVDGKLISYDLRQFKHTACFNLNAPLSGVDLSPNRNEMAISTCDGQLRSYDTRYMKTPLHTVVAYETWIKKIKFSPIHQPPTKTKKFVNDYEGPKQVLGDFQNQRKYDDVGPSVSEQEVQHTMSLNQYKQLLGRLEDRLKTVKSQFEEKLLQHFYALRIDASKAFIGIEEKIETSWREFLKYMKRKENKSSTQFTTPFGNSASIEEFIAQVSVDGGGAGDEEL